MGGLTCYQAFLIAVSGYVYLQLNLLNPYELLCRTKVGILQLQLSGEKS